MILPNLNASQDLFQQYPLHDLRKIPGGNVPVPYHVYNGTALFIGGTANLERVKKLLARENLNPVQTTLGEALICLWVCNFTRSSLGPHKMLQASICVALEPLPPVEPQPLALLATLLTMPQVGIYCQRTWTDNARVAFYQSELLGLDVRPAQGEFSQDSDERKVDFEFWEVSNGETLFSAQVRERAYTTPRSALSLLRRLGLSGFLQVSRQPRFALRTVAPCGAGSLSERVSLLFWYRQRAVTQFFDPSGDRLFLNNSVYPDVEFHPQFIERLEGFKMVYLLPGKPKG